LIEQYEAAIASLKQDALNVATETKNQVDALNQELATAKADLASALAELLEAKDGDPDEIERLQAAAIVAAKEKADLEAALNAEVEEDAAIAAKIAEVEALLAN
jgi:predicted  nucleic acid-binding Zn-ribbon protein